MKNRLLFIIRRPVFAFEVLLSKLPFFRFVRDTIDYQCPISVRQWITQCIFNKGGSKYVPWPVHFTSRVVNPKNIKIGIDTNPGYMPGCYIQGVGKVEIGDYTQVGPQVVIISANHLLTDTRKHLEGNVKIGKYGWLGAGCKIMPNVELGDFVIVGAGAVVTKSFAQGYCVIAGNPARIIKELDPQSCVRYEYQKRYVGFFSEEAYKMKFK
jgi:acetyltransferase-like isoleucine patch superfamily enzyme